MKIGHDNFILVVHGNKMRAWMRRQKQVMLVVKAETVSCCLWTAFTVSRLNVVFIYSLSKAAIIK